MSDASNDVPLRLHCMAPAAREMQEWLDATKRTYGIDHCDVLIRGLSLDDVDVITTYVVMKGWVLPKHGKMAKKMYEEGRL